MFSIVSKFEQTIADFFGAKYAVATDCCTHAIELCMRYTDANNLTIPSHTYVSVPMTMTKLGLTWSWQEELWEQYYLIGNTDIIDAATFWKENGYMPNTYMCISFQFNKHLSLGRGGVILLDKKTDYSTLKKMSYDGRDLSRPWADQDISTLGYHYYMTPETAEAGLQKFIAAKISPPRKWTYQDYPYLPNLSVFKNKQC